jgi:hypothetical protein
MASRCREWFTRAPYEEIQAKGNDREEWESVATQVKVLRGPHSQGVFYLFLWCLLLTGWQRLETLILYALTSFCELQFLTTLHCHDLSAYKRVLDLWPDLLGSLMQRMTALYSTLFYIYIYTHTHTQTHQCPQSRLHCRCLIATSNGGRSPCSGFPNYPRASATSF